MKRKNVILADCEESEIEDFVRGLQEVSKQEFIVKTSICNGKHSLISNIKRYLIYACYPIKFIFFRKKYNYIIGWQQFFALFYVLYCNILKVKKDNIVVAYNFTYKSKSRL